MYFSFSQEYFQNCTGSFSLFQDSRLVTGVAFKKAFSYAGFEMQPKKYKNPKIAMLNIELELKAEKDNAEVRVDTAEVRVFVAILWLTISLSYRCYKYSS